MNNFGIAPQFGWKPDSWRHAKNTLGMVPCSVSLLLDGWKDGSPKAGCRSLNQCCWVVMRAALIYSIGIRPCNDLMAITHQPYQSPSITATQISPEKSFHLNIRSDGQIASWPPLCRRNPPLVLTFAIHWSELIIWWKTDTAKQRMCSFVLYKGVLSNHICISVSVILPLNMYMYAWKKKKARYVFHTNKY